MCVHCGQCIRRGCLSVGTRFPTLGMASGSQKAEEMRAVGHVPSGRFHEELMALLV